MRRALAAIDIAAVRARQRTQERTALIGVGLSIYCEQAAHGTSVYAGWGFQWCRTRAGQCAHDAGRRTRDQGRRAFARPGPRDDVGQVAHEILGLDTKKVRVVHGDTAITPYSTGTWAHARWSWPVARLVPPALKIGERAKRIGAKLLQLDPAWLHCATAVCADQPAASAFQKSHMPGIGVRRICRTMSIPEAGDNQRLQAAA